MKETKTFCPRNKKDWRRWLWENHQKEDFIWLIFYKKNAPKSNLNWSEAVDEALCFGWIDSLVKSIDEDRYMQYFCKRKPNSHWSRINKDKVKALLENGLIEEAGLKSIAIAKENGSWTYLDSVEALEIPDDLQEAFDRHHGSEEYYKSLSKSVKKSMLYWILSAKRESTRQNRITEIAENAAQGRKPKQFG